MKNLVPGHKYTIELDDCCIQGTLIGTFLHWEHNPENGNDQGPDVATFNFGTIGPKWGAWDAKEIQ